MVVEPRIKKKLKIHFLQLHRAQSRVVDYRMHHAKIERDQTIPKDRSIEIYYYR